MGGKLPKSFKTLCLNAHNVIMCNGSLDCLMSLSLTAHMSVYKPVAADKTVSKGFGSVQNYPLKLTNTHVESN